MFKFNHDFSSRFRILKGGKISLVVSAILGSAIISYAAPTQGVVTSGTATISQTGNVTSINQSSGKASINWQGFSINSNETVNFNQPNVNSVTLNRVVGNERTIIDGALNANGQVWILNANGVLFNKNAKVNTAGLIATTKNISDTDFQKGEYKFSGESNETVINMGTIEAKDSGYVALLANKIENDGTIKAYKGTVHFIGAKEATINLNGNSIVSFTVNKGVVDALIENKGAIIADGGKIYLTTNAVNELLKSVVNNTGIIEADSMDDVLGEVSLMANNGEVINSGSIDVSSANGKAGKIIVTGENTTITQTATLKADGKTGGGTIYVGGSWQNSDTTVSQSTKTTVEKNAKITANATN
jgi:filamentous hemagglutinin family protein